MAFGETIFAKTFNLLETAFGKFFFISIFHHAFNHLHLKGMNGANPAERCHSAAQFIRFPGRKISRNNGDFHRLFLKKRHA